MASIRKTPRKGGFNYQVRWKEEGTNRTETFATEAEATKFRGMVDAAGQRLPEGWVKGYGIVDRPANSDGGTTLREFFPEAIQGRPNASPEMKRRYMSQFERWVPDELKDRPMNLITPLEAGKWVSNLLQGGVPPIPVDRPTTRAGRAELVAARKEAGPVRKPIAKKTAHNIFGMVSSVMKQAMNEGLVSRNPFMGLGKGMRDGRAKKTILEPEELDLILFELAQVEPLYAELASFLFWTGLRFGEATGLMWKDIDYTRAVVVVERAWKRQADNSYKLGEPKTGNGFRDVVLDEDVIAMLRTRDPRLRATTRAESFAAEDALVWPNAVKGGRLSQSIYYQDHWLPAVGDARRNHGLTKMPRVHDLRHSHASYMLANGLDILTLSRRLGHSSVAVTGDIYGHLTASSDDRIRATIAKGKNKGKAGGKKAKKKAKKLRAVDAA